MSGHRTKVRHENKGDWILDVSDEKTDDFLYTRHALIICEAGEMIKHVIFVGQN